MKNVRHQRPWTSCQLRPMAATSPVFSTNITGRTAVHPTRIQIHSGKTQNATSIRKMRKRKANAWGYLRRPPRITPHSVRGRPSADWHTAKQTAPNSKGWTRKLTTTPTAREAIAGANVVKSVGLLEEAWVKNSLNRAEYP